MDNLEEAVMQSENFRNSALCFYRKSVTCTNWIAWIWRCKWEAYGAAIYLCAEDKVGKRISNLIMAKSRVAPTRRITLPWLELLAAYLTAKLISYVLKALKTPVQDIYAWSDSQIVLSWIKQPCSKWKFLSQSRARDTAKGRPGQWASLFWRTKSRWFINQRNFH